MKREDGLDTEKFKATSELFRGALSNVYKVDELRPELRVVEREMGRILATLEPEVVRFALEVLHPNKSGKMVCIPALLEALQM